MPRTKVQAQLAIDETVIEDDDLEAALEERLRFKDDYAEAGKVYRDKDAIAKGLIEKNLGGGDDDQVFRIGRFRVTRKLVEGRAVTFETKDKTSTTIRLVER